MKRGLGFVIGAALLAAAVPAVAGTVYRCDGPNGRTYASKRVPGAQCVVAASYKASRTRYVPPAPAAPVTAAVGSVDSTLPAATATQAQATPAKPKQPRFVRMGSSTTYSYVDRNGVRNYSNVRPRGVANVMVKKVTFPIFEMETCYACGVNPSVNFGNVRLNTTDYQAEISAAALEFGVEEAIVRAIIHAESAYRYNAVSRVGAQGLMQLMPATARRFGVSNAFDPSQNIRGGVKYLSWLLKRFNGDLTLAAAGYNAGEGAVDKYKGVPPYNETRRYVERVRMLADRYRGGVAAR